MAWLDRAAEALVVKLSRSVEIEASLGKHTENILGRVLHHAKTMPRWHIWDKHKRERVGASK